MLEFRFRRFQFTQLETMEFKIELTTRWTVALKEGIVTEKEEYNIESLFQVKVHELGLLIWHLQII